MKKENSILLHYLGCSAFVISDSEGTCLALDLWTKGAFPYAEDTPEELDLGDPPAFSALLVSHDHKDHSFIPPGVPIIYGVQSRKVEDNPNISRVGNITIGKFSSQHFASDAKRPKLNAVFLLTIAGMKIVHLGDAHGTMADESQLIQLKQKIGDLDLLLIPIGSPWMKPVDVSILDRCISILNPRISLPMHYWTLAGKAEVLSGLSSIGYQLVTMTSNSVEFITSSLPSRDSKTVWNIPAGKINQ
jgi:L-ascorbate metabolism protein UlaG (beta-lactamase superfamily)